MNDFDSRLVLKALVSRIKDARNTSANFKAKGLYDSAEMWDTVAGVLEGVLYDADLAGIVRQIKNGEI